MQRPVIVLLLQAWSTAISQKKNRTMAQAPRIFTNMDPPRLQTNSCILPRSAPPCSDSDHPGRAAA